jgi:zinc protease
MPEFHRAERGGATLLTISDHGLPLVRYVVALRHGALVDGDGRAGLTRVALDLALRGTERRDRTAFNEELERLGSTLRAQAGSEAALLRGVCLRRNLEPTLDLVGEALARPALTEEELALLVDEVVDGLRAERDDDETLSELFLRRALYAGHPLSRSPHGELGDVARLDRRAVRVWHGARVRAPELVVVLAGDVAPHESTAIADRLLSGLSAAAVELPAVPPVPTPRMRIVVVDKPERTQVQLRVACPALGGTHPDVFAFWVGIVAFGGTFTSPFTQQVRDERGWSYFASADFDWRSRNRAPLVLRSAPAATDLLDCLELELQLLTDLAAGQLADSAIELARTYLLNHYPLQLSTPSDLLVPALRTELLGRPAGEIFTLPDRLEHLRAADVARAVSEHLDAAGAVICMVATAEQVLEGLQKRFPAAEVDVVDFREGLGL